jgi:saccharopine dehydrogenase (NAD+, L-lysine-forming)
MSARLERISVLGAGNVGTLVAVLLDRAGFTVKAFDHKEPEDTLVPVRVADLSNPAVVSDVLEGQQAVVSCLPYYLNKEVARCAFDLGIHYFDLTEDVASTEAIRTLSATARGVLAPQCGLAPGFIAIAGAALAADFEELRSIERRVGALPQHPSGLLGYAFNWSPEGVVNEYLNDCEVIENGRRRTVPSMSQLETIVINGIQLEAFSTSGGLGTMCETFDSRVRTLNYKTLRYPGHCRQMQFFFKELHMQDNRDAAGAILVNAKPPVNEDVVYIHAAVEGKRRRRIFRDEFVRAYYPREIGGRTWRAIAWTTAASVCAVIEMVAAGDMPGRGFIKQEDIKLARFLQTKNGALYKDS